MYVITAAWGKICEVIGIRSDLVQFLAEIDLDDLDVYNEVSFHGFMGSGILC